MRWLLKEPSLGDMIRVSFGDFYHYGIYVSDDEVIQFGLAPTQRSLIPDSEVEVLASDIDAFLGGGFLEVAEFDKKETKKHRSPRETVEYAKSKIGMRGYNILYNNCEHFANECLSGVAYCEQTESVRAMFRNLAVVDVYVAAIPEDLRIAPVIPKEREKQIRSAGCESVRRERYFVWRLLEYALERSFGLKMKKLDFSLSDEGKWNSKECEFSLSHSGGVVAVAVSRSPIGVDIEERASAARLAGMVDAVLTESEKAEYLALRDSEREDFLLRAWTSKEAFFKRGSASVFRPSAISVDASENRSMTVILGRKEYALSISSSDPGRLRLYENIDTQKIIR